MIDEPQRAVDCSFRGGIVSKRHEEAPPRDRLQAIASGTKPAADDELPASTRKNAKANPFVQLVAEAVKTGKRYDLPGRFSLAPYAGRKNACEAQTVVSHLHAAGRVEGVKLAVRRFDATEDGVRIAFRVQA